MRVEKIEVPAYVREAMEKPLRYLFARADKGGAGWIGRLDAPNGETFGGIMFYAEKGASVVHVLALSETEAKMWPICRWTCERPNGWEEIVAYMPPATAYCAREMAYRIPLHGVECDRWWMKQCRSLARLLRKGLVVSRYASYRKEVEEDKRDMLLRWRMGDPRPAPRHKAWRLDWMVGAGMTPWDMVRRSAGDYPMEKDNPVGRRMMRRVAAFRRDYM